MNLHRVPFWGYLAGCKSVSARLPARPTRTMTNTALEAIASSSGKTTPAKRLKYNLMTEYDQRG